MGWFEEIDLWLVPGISATAVYETETTTIHLYNPVFFIHINMYKKQCIFTIYKNQNQIQQAEKYV
jgi:hypothetical protein